jgi:putative ABC transport system substrate-binding protein
VDPTTGASQVTMTASAALSLNLKLEVLEVRRREEVAAAVRAARNSQADALNVFSSPILASLHREIITLAAEYRLPAIYQWKEHVEAGGWYPMGQDLRRYGGSPQSSWGRSSKALSLPTYRSSNRRSSSWH